MALPRISWGSVFAGSIGAIAVLLFLGLLGLAIGSTAADPAEPGGMRGLGVGAGIWSLVSFAAALFLGAWIASRLAGVRQRTEGLIHGFVVWGIVMILTFTTIGSGVSGALRGVLGMMGGTVQTAARSGAITNVDDAFQNLGERARSAEGREQAYRLLTAVGVEPREARSVIDEAQRSAEQGTTTPELDARLRGLKEQALLRAQRATEALARGAWWTVLGVTIALVSALIGGVVGNLQRHPGTGPLSPRLAGAVPG